MPGRRGIGSRLIELWVNEPIGYPSRESAKWLGFVVFSRDDGQVCRIRDVVGAGQDAVVADVKTCADILTIRLKYPESANCRMREESRVWNARFPGLPAILELLHILQRVLRVAGCVASINLLKSVGSRR